LRRRLRAAVLLGGRGGGRLPDADTAAAPRVAAAPFFARLRLDLVRVARRASRMINQPIAMITSTPAMKSPKTPIVLTVGSLELVFELRGVVGVGVVGGGVGAGWAGASGPNGLPPGAGAGAGVGVGVGAGAPLCAAASGAAIKSATRAARRVGRARNGYPGDVPPELGAGLGAGVPPLFGSLGGVPEVPGVVPGLAGCCAGGVAVPPVDGTDGVAGVPVLGVPPPEPPIGAPPLPSFAFLFFFVSPGCTGSPVVTGGTTGCTVWLDPEPSSPPPLDATAITTIRKKATTASATSRRRR
jgi:hypothetical protein